LTEGRRLEKEGDSAHGFALIIRFVECAGLHDLEKRKEKKGKKKKEKKEEGRRREGAAAACHRRAGAKSRLVGKGGESRLRWWRKKACSPPKPGWRKEKVAQGRAFGHGPHSLLAVAYRIVRGTDHSPVGFLLQKRFGRARRRFLSTTFFRLPGGSDRRNSVATTVAVRGLHDDSAKVGHHARKRNSFEPRAFRAEELAAAQQSGETLPVFVIRFRPRGARNSQAANHRPFNCCLSPAPFIRCMLPNTARLQFAPRRRSRISCSLSGRKEAPRKQIDGLSRPSPTHEYDTSIHCENNERPRG